MNLDYTEARATARNLATEKEIKVRIPVPYHIKLHTIKVLHGQSISTTVREALDAYFAAFEANHQRDEGQQRLSTWGPRGPLE